MAGFSGFPAKSKSMSVGSPETLDVVPVEKSTKSDSVDVIVSFGTTIEIVALASGAMRDEAAIDFAIVYFMIYLDYT